MRRSSLTTKPCRRQRLVGLELLESRCLLARVELLPVADNTLYENATGAQSNGAGEFMFVGQASVRAGNKRGLLKFDVESAIPSGSQIDAVTLQLHMSRTSSLAHNVTLHRVLADWGEGTSDAAANEGQGAPSTIGDATWVHRFFDAAQWQQMGGDFVATASASTSVSGIGNYQWTSESLISDVQMWLDDPDTQFGWLLHGNEAVQPSTKRFDSRENSTAANRPRLIIDFTPQNQAPTDITLSNSSIAEDVDTTSDVLVGNLTAVDPDGSDTHSFELVTGQGSEDNDLFQIDGSRLELKAGTSLDHETKPQLKVRVSANEGGLSYVKSLSIDVTNVNEVATAIDLDSATIAEDTNVGSAVFIGNLSATDPDAGDSHTFELVAGLGDNDNGLFQINGSKLELKAGTSLDHEVKPQLVVRIAATDQGGLSVSQVFDIDVTDANDVPTDITLDVSTIDEDSDTTEAVLIGLLAAVDQDAGDSHTFDFAIGDGDANNDLFQIDGARLELRAGVVLDRQTTPQYSVRVSATDQDDLAISKSFLIDVVSGNEPPVVEGTLARHLTTSDTSYQFQLPSDLFSDPDPPPEGSLTLSARLVSGAELPAWLLFNSQTGTFQGTPLDADAGFFSIAVTATDAGDPPLSSTVSYTLIVTRSQSPWQNPINRLDTNFDNFVVPLDVLAIINQLNNPTVFNPATGKLNDLPNSDFSAPPFLFDVSGDGFLVPLDGLSVINALNAGAGEAESAGRTVWDMQFFLLGWEAWLNGEDL